MLRNALVCLGLMLILSCCSTVPTGNPSFSGLDRPAQGEALVYVYRPKNFTGGGVRYAIDVGQGAVATLPNCSYTFLRLKPGSYTLSAIANHSFSRSPGSLPFTVEPGDRRFFLLDIYGSVSVVPVGPTPIGISSTSIAFRSTNETDAVRYMSGCYLVTSSAS